VLARPSRSLTVRNRTFAPDTCPSPENNHLCHLVRVRFRVIGLVLMLRVTLGVIGVRVGIIVVRVRVRA